MSVVVEQGAEVVPDLGGPWRQSGGSYWIIPQNGDAHAVARRMLDCGARLITITATQPAESSEIRLDYHWDIRGSVYTCTLLTREKAVASIYDVCEAANWIEREVHEYFAVEFAGRVCEPLFLRAGQPAGLHLREEEE